jgi:hypothetical protein
MTVSSKRGEKFVKIKVKKNNEGIYKKRQVRNEEDWMN